MISTPIHDELQHLLQIETTLGAPEAEPIADAAPDSRPAHAARHLRA